MPALRLTFTGVVAAGLMFSPFSRADDPLPQAAPGTPSGAPVRRAPVDVSSGEGAPRNYADDDGRVVALAASATIFAVGTLASGIAYLVTAEDCSGPSWATCPHRGDTVALVMYGVSVGAVPSIPRWVVGDVRDALLYTGARAASVLTAALVPWGGAGDVREIGPVLLGVLAPITLGIVDLATTPHREDLVRDPRPDVRQAGPRLTGVSPVVLREPRRGADGALLGVSVAY